MTSPGTISDHIMNANAWGFYDNLFVKEICSKKWCNKKQNKELER